MVFPNLFNIVRDFILLVNPVLEFIGWLIDHGRTSVEWIRNNIFQSSPFPDQETSDSQAPLLPPGESFDFAYGLNASVPDEYRFANNVPKNPPRLTLDYDSPMTSEGQLKQAVLEESSSNVVEVFADGMGGIGKTCALRGLATDPDVMNRFEDGILFIKLGNDASRATLMRNIRIIINETGGKKLANNLGTTKSLHVVVKSASEWFEAQSCLFLVDDVWRTNGIGNSDLRALSGISQGRSRMVYTTRDKQLAINGQNKITFGPRTPATSRMMLMNRSFDGDRRLSQQNEEALQTILRVCAGHPLSLSVAGGIVRTMAHQHVSNPYNALQYVSTQLRSNVFPGTEDDDYGHVSRVVDISLTSFRLRGNQSYDQLLAKLCLLQKQDEPPIAVLHRIWGVSDPESSDRLAKSFNDCSIIELRLHDDSRKTFAVHDIIVDIAKDRAGSNRKQFARQLLDNYMPKNWFGHRDWWCCKNDKYIHDNLCRLLAAGDCKEELMWLLSKPQWIIMRLQEGGATAVENDIQHGKHFVGSEDTSTGTHVRHLQVVQEAALMAHPYVSSNKYEAWFQMNGRLLSHAQACERTERFVREIEENAPRPWAKASLGLLDAAGGALRHVLRIDGSVLHVSFMENKAHFLTKSAVSTINILNGEIDRKNLKNIFTGSVCLAMSADGKRVVAGYRDGTVIVWEVDSGEVVNEPLQGHTDWVTCVAISRDGKQVVSGSRDKTVRVWAVDSGEVVNEPLQGHTARVSCVGISEDGKRVVSGSDDKTVRVWEVDSREVVNSPLQGHTAKVTCVAISEDGKRVVSGSKDKTVRVWEVDCGEVVNAPLQGHIDLVSCVAISRNGKRVVSGSWDKTVRMWEADSGEVVNAPLQGHSDWMTCVAISEDGKRVVSGSRDKTVRVWEADSGEVVSAPLQGHTAGVSCAAISEDGKRVVSGSWDTTVRVWDVNSGEVVNAPLQGHTDGVSCVAISGDGKRTVSGSRDKTVRVWSIDSGVSVGTPLLHGDYVSEVAVDENGRFVVSRERLSDFDRLWDVQSGRCICTSEESRWQSEVDKLSLTWSSILTRTDVIQWPLSDGQLTLATLQSKGFRFERIIFKDDFSAHCRVVDN